MLAVVEVDKTLGDNFFTGHPV